MSRFPRLDDLPKNANYVGIRMKMTDSIIEAQLEGKDYQDLMEDYKCLLEERYGKMDDSRLQEYYDILEAPLPTEEELDKLLNDLEDECKDILEELEDMEDEESG